MPETVDGRARTDIDRVQTDLSRAFDRLALVESRTAAQAVSIEMIERDAKRAVTLDQFLPVKAIVYGIAGAALLAVIGAVIRLVVGNHMPGPLQ